jgi:two-component system, cell cycle sensor histidine kinase and response regulator CckA
MVVTTPPQPEAEVVRAAAVDAVVLLGAGAVQHAAAIATLRPDLPLVVLADVDEPAALELLVIADDVLAAQATVPLVARAVRQAIARRRRRTAAVSTTHSHGDASDRPELRQLQAVGRLAAGLGHEFNNLLLVVSGNAELLHQRLPDGHQLKTAAEAITEAGRRAAMLTRQLLAFGRQQTLVPAPMDLNAVVSDAVPALRKAMGKYVQVLTELSPVLPQVRVDADQLKEVLSNLAATALEAMPVGGTFSIATDTYAVRESDRRGRPWLPPGEYVRLRISDTGLGVEEQALPHLFEPFFATKTGTRGGLVLSSVYGVVKQSGGYIWVESAVSNGTTVTILLPPLSRLSATPRPPAAHPAAQKPSVLLVEDLDAVRDVLTTLLDMHGFDVASAGSAEAALELARSRAFDVLLTDVALPSQSGPDLAREIRLLSPGTAVLLMSGHPANAIDPRDLKDARGFLQKPFTASALVQRLHELLGRTV